MIREVLFAALLAVGGGMIAFGASLITPAAGWITGGILLVGWSWFVLSEGR